MRDDTVNSVLLEAENNIKSPDKLYQVGPKTSRAQTSSQHPKLVGCMIKNIIKKEVWEGQTGALCRIIHEGGEYQKRKAKAP
jgi:hypothetical protein